MSTSHQARVTLPSIPHYVNVFNKKRKTHQQLTPQVSPLLQRLQAEFDIACALQERMHIRINTRAALARIFG